ncbi:MAG: hypothetical protein JWM80_4773 [Cyanobacteria bacterium RYN_339]|nr:hypothetical protein [Cyanobacteria bacterium RYN_339]
MRIPAAALALGLVLLAPTPALACGGFFCMSQPMDQSGERIMFVQDGGDVTAHVLINYQGDAKQFSWVVPTPTEPKLGVGSEALFRTVDAGTRPSFQLKIKDLGDCYWQPRRYEAEDRAAAPSAAESNVQVVSREQVGPYDTAVIRSDDPDALRRWLRANGYVLPAKLDPLLDPYVAGKYYFVALKLQQDRAAGDLQPITMRYRASKPGIPIRLTGVAATPNMDVYVWVLGDDRAIPENYRHAEINEARVDWLSGGANYKAVVTRAADEAGGQAFVTDFAGDAKAVDLSVFDDAKQDLKALATLRDPIAFLRAIQEDGYFQRGSPQALAFVRRYVPIPKSMKDVWEPGFYSNPEQYRQQLRREGVTVNAAKAAKELEEIVVKPNREILAQFGRHHYLTRLYTTMSPEEMTQDPTFRFNPYLPKVDNVHVADGERDCRNHKDGETAPIRVTLKDGTRFTIYPEKGRTPYGIEEGLVPVPLASVTRDREMPFARKIEQLNPMGPGSIIQDNSAAIATALDPTLKEATRPAEGMGCSNRSSIPGTNPTHGMGEPVTYALIALGAWGFKRRRRP